MALVKFVSCNAAQFTGLSAKDEGTLYFVTDEQRLYKGAVPYSGGIYSAVTAFPEAGARNTLYINTNTGEVKYWNGTGYVQVVKPFATTLTASDNAHLPTSKAVADYVATQVKDLNVSALEVRVAANETAVKTTLPGKITEAQTAAENFATEKVTALQNGQVATNKAAIEGLKTGKADKAATLAGYGIGDAYTKTQADSAIAAAIAKAPHLKRKIVTVLPAVSEADANTIYMVGTGAGAETSNYKEYMVIEGKFELLGDSKVDLTNYATKAYADEKAGTAKSEAIADATGKIATAKSEAISAAATDATSKANAAKEAAISAAGTATDTKISTAIGKLDKADAAVSGQYVSAVSETDGIISVTRAALPTYTLVSGTNNGTVAFNGKDVAVKGLGSAAYANTSAFDVAGAASGAETRAKAYADGLAKNYATAAQGTKADQAFAALTWGTL